jgi:hypothetical protein
MVPVIAGPLSISIDSVTSISSRQGSMAVASSTWLTSSQKSGWRKWIGEMFTAMPRSGHALMSRQARISAHRPISRTKPVASAIGMSSDGVTHPSPGR